MRILIFGIFGLCVACQQQEEKQEMFRKIDPELSGVTFSNDLDDSGDMNIIEYLYFYNGGGVAVGDINNDGLDDLYFTGNQVPDKLYLNRGNLQFEDVSEIAGVGDAPGWSTGVVMADVNGDGYSDIYVCKVGDYKSLQGHNLLYLNNQDGTFHEISAKVGLNFKGFSTHASFFDYDRDGDLDMYLLNHSVHTARSYLPVDARMDIDPKAGDRLYENKLNEGVLFFEDITNTAGIYSSALGYGLGLVTTDINQDGWMDIYVGNDFHEDDYLYINQRDGSFLESSKKLINHTSRFTMGVDVADVNGDSYLDIFSLDMLPYDQSILMKSGGEDGNKVTETKLRFGYKHQYARNAFQLNQKNRFFSDIALLTDTYATDWSWSVLLQDYDNNGLTDIFITNGIYKRPNDLDYINFMSNVAGDEEDRKLIERMPTLEIPNRLFSNQGQLRFEEVSDEWGIAEPSYSNGAMYSDLDLDGDLDIVVNNVNAKASIYENLLEHENDSSHFIQFKLLGGEMNKDAIGAKITMYRDDNVFHRELLNSRGFQSSPSMTMHFGLGNYDYVDSIVVQWPDGLITRMPEKLSADTLYYFDKPAEGSMVVDSPTDTLPISYLDYFLKENHYNDYDQEILIPEKLSTEGPAAVVADFTGDGYEDLFIGAARGLQSVLIRGDQNGLSGQLEQPFDDAHFEAVDATAFDFEGDGDQDLYVVRGGNDYPYESDFYQDHLYINDGKGRFSLATMDLPRVNGSCVSSRDYDQDGDIDLFVGSRSVPGGYGLVPVSFLLENKRDSFRVAYEWQVGMVTDAAWVDYDRDGLDDLVIVGDWMPVTVLKNDGKGVFINYTAELGLEATNGFWNDIHITDTNKDGFPDLLVGNIGLYSKLQASRGNPVVLFLDDFDANSTPDPVIFHHRHEAFVPFASKDELVAQMPFLKKKFLSYNEFSKVRSIRKLTNSDTDKIEHVQFIHELRSCVFLYKNGHYIKQPLPKMAQLSSVNGFATFNISKEERAVVYIGNFFGLVTSHGRSDASPGGVILFDDQGEMSFKNLLPIPFNKEYRKIVTVNNDKFVIIPSEGQPILIDRQVVLNLFAKD